VEARSYAVKEDASSPSEVDRSLLGAATPPFICEIEKGAIRRFAEAIGDLNPLYCDEAYAFSRGYRSVVAPPTFPVALRPPEDPPWISQVDRTRILAGEQTFIYTRPIVAGDILSCQLHFVAVEDKQGSLGHMQVLTQELRGTDLQGQTVFTHRRLSIVREKSSVLRT
jgi:acyl dehydratase